MRAWIGLGLAALLALWSLQRALHLPPQLLGEPRSCTRAQLVDGVLRCDEELLHSSLQLCERLPARALRAGDAVEREPLCAEVGARAPRVSRMTPEALAALAQAVDVNRASLEELASLPGVGPTIAARIAARRPYAALDELLEVRGIGRKRLRRLRLRATVGGLSRCSPSRRCPRAR